MGNSEPITDNSGKEVVLKKVPCIYYPVQFQEGQEQKSQKQKGQEQVKALLDSNGKINAMSPAFASKLGLHIRKINVRA